MGGPARPAVPRSAGQPGGAPPGGGGLACGAAARPGSTAGCCAAGRPAHQTARVGFVGSGGRPAGYRAHPPRRAARVVPGRGAVGDPPGAGRHPPPALGSPCCDLCPDAAGPRGGAAWGQVGRHRPVRATSHRAHDLPGRVGPSVASRRAWGSAGHVAGCGRNTPAAGRGAAGVPPGRAAAGRHRPGMAPMKRRAFSGSGGAAKLTSTSRRGAGWLAVLCSHPSTPGPARRPRCQFVPFRPMPCSQAARVPFRG